MKKEWHLQRQFKGMGEKDYYERKNGFWLTSNVEMPLEKDDHHESMEEMLNGKLFSNSRNDDERLFS